MADQRDNTADLMEKLKAWVEAENKREQLIKDRTEALDNEWCGQAVGLKVLIDQQLTVINQARLALLDTYRNQ